MRKLDKRFVEIDLVNADAKERMRSAPVLDAEAFNELWQKAPEDTETALMTEDIAEDLTPAPTAAGK
jgi:HD-like signal output (HDOD) protein